jgi:hypothetical protein
MKAWPKVIQKLLQKHKFNAMLWCARRAPDPTASQADNADNEGSLTKLLISLLALFLTEENFDV